MKKADDSQVGMFTFSGAYWVRGRKIQAFFSSLIGGPVTFPFTIMAAWEWYHNSRKPPA